MSEPVVPLQASLRDAVEVLERTRRMIVAVLGPERQLEGVLSDGDVRRALLRGIGLDAPVRVAMTVRPVVAGADLSPDDVAHVLRVRGVAAMPLVDEAGRFVRIATNLDQAGERREWTGGQGFAAAVIMAGGEGRRLRPLTNDRPKPMIEIGGVPLLERQVRAMVAGGLTRIFISTNYLGYVIEDHFGDGSEFGAEIAYLRETRKLGTAGALSLMPRRPEGPLLVINGDVLTTIDFGHMLAYHRETQAFASVAAIVYRVEIPFGVLRLDGHFASAIEEKPSEKFLCNAGVYVLSPEAYDTVPPETEINMTDIIARGIAERRKVAVFPLHEYWSDIGNHSDLASALRDFGPDPSGLPGSTTP